MKSKKPWIDPKNLNTAQKFLIAMGLLGIIVIAALLLVPPKELVLTPTPTGEPAPVLLPGLPDQPRKAPLGFAYNDEGRLIYVGAGFDNLRDV